VARFPVLERFPAAHAQLGHSTHLVSRSDQDSRAIQSGVHLEGVRGRSRLEALFRLTERICALEPDVIHLNGIIPTNALLACRLRHCLPSAVLALQDQVVRWDNLSPWARAALRAGLQSADIAFFAARALALRAVESGALDDEQVVELPGGATEMLPSDPCSARERTGLSGDPLYLWVG
jgi:hypothetical protein